MIRPVAWKAFNEENRLLYQVVSIAFSITCEQALDIYGTSSTSSNVYFYTAIHYFILLAVSK